MKNWFKSGDVVKRKGISQERKKVEQNVAFKRRNEEVSREGNAFLLLEKEERGGRCNWAGKRKKGYQGPETCRLVTLSRDVIED